MEGGPVQERKQKRLTQPDQHPLPPPTPPHPTPTPTEQELEVYWREKTIDHRAKASQHPATLSLSAKLFEASGTQSTGTEKGGDSPPPHPVRPMDFCGLCCFFAFFLGRGGGVRGGRGPPRPPLTVDTALKTLEKPTVLELWWPPTEGEGTVQQQQQQKMGQSRDLWFGVELVQKLLQGQYPETFLFWSLLGGR